MAAAAGIGPLVAGGIFDLTGGYALLLMAGVPAAIMAALAVFRLGPYPVFEPVTPQAPLAERPAPAI
jgi:cyanate permease